MRIGLVTKWFSSGQATVARYVRAAFEELGHETFVLARPGKGPRAGGSDTYDAIWDQPGVTHASQQEVPTQEYARWASDNGLDAAFFDNAYEFDEIRDGLRANGVRTVGRVVWEHFSPEDVGPANDAFDVIYAVTDAERERYRGLGVEAVRVRFGCHPELLAIEPHRDPDRVTLVWPGSFMGRRQPLYEATAFGMPIITNDDPPMNEIVTDGLNGILIASHPDGTTRSGIEAKAPDVDDMARAIEAICDDALRAKLSEGAIEVRERLSWSRTVEDLGKLLDADRK